MNQLQRTLCAIATVAMAAGLIQAGGDVEPALASSPPTVTLSGNPQFDSDSIAASDAKQPRWLSYPGSRFVLNPNAVGATEDTSLTLDEGAYFGRGVSLGDMVHVGLASVGGAPSPAALTTSTWYPYKLDFSGSYSTPAGAAIHGSDYYVDASGTIVRHLRVDAAAPVDVTLGGTVPSGDSATWDAADDVLLVTGPSYDYAIRFEQGPNPSPLAETASVSGSTWTFIKRFDNGGDLDIAIGQSVSPDTSAAAVSRAQGALTGSIATSTGNAKAVFDNLLRQVPTPSHFGISRVNQMGLATNSVSAADAQNGYYRAWTFLLQQPENAFPDYASQGFNYPQIALGKPSLFNDTTFDPLASSATWDSLFAMQLMAFIPSESGIAFSSLAGLLSRVQSDGSIAGEALPTRMAQTAWTLYEQTHDLSTLTTLYPQLKSFLLYMEQNPHWNEGTDPAETKDLEYVASWLVDEKFAEKIAQEVGQSADVAMWQSHAATELNNIRAWFYSDPSALHQIDYPSTGAHYSTARPGDDPEAITSALSVPGLPSDLRDRTLAYFRQHFNSSIGAFGLNYTKFPDTDLTATGLLDSNTGTLASEYINAGIRDAVFPGDFSEQNNRGNGLTVAFGVMPSDFSASQVIAFTLLQNGLRYDSGVPTTFTADTGDGGFRSGFENGDPTTTSIGSVEPTGRVQGVTGICCGLTGPETSLNNGEVNSGSQAIVYSGSGATGDDYAFTKVFDISANPVVVTPTTTLEYSIFPQTSATTTLAVNGNNSSYVAVDVVFSDGTVLRNLGAVDQNGNGMHPVDQGGHLLMDQWNRVVSQIGSVANGKSIVRIGIGYDQPNSPGGGYRGFVDDISIQ